MEFLPKQLVNEWAFRLSDGIPDYRNRLHLIELKNLLIERKFPHQFVDGLLSNLLNEQSKKLTKQEILDSLKKHKKLEQQGSVKTKIYGDMEPDEFIRIIKFTFENSGDVKWYEANTGPNQSGRDRLFQWKDGNHDNQIHLAKTSITGRGTRQTQDQELSWLLVLSGMQYGANPSNKEEFISQLISTPVIYNRVEGVSETDALHLAAFLENNDDWYKSNVAQCKKFMSIVGATNQPKKYVKDGSTLPVNIQAKKLYQQEYGRKLDLDKWNPADVWLEYKTVPTFKTLAELNNWLIDSLYKGTGYIGVSLKKGGGKVGLVNDYERKEYKLSSLSTKYGGLFSQGVSFDYKGKNLDGLGLAFRIFQGKPTETIRGEGTAKGAQAVQGKVAMSVIDDFKSGTLKKVESVRGVSVKYDKKTKTWDWDSKGLSRFKKVQTAFTKIKKAKFDHKQGSWSAAFEDADSFIKVLNDYTNKKKVAENSIKANINSRFQTIILGSIVTTLSTTDLEKIMVGMLRYGKSESDWSSAHYKAQ